MEFVQNLAKEQRKRLVGSLMTFAEQEMYPYLPDDVKKRYREKVLQTTGQYHDMVLDCLKASISDSTVVNEQALEMLRQIHQAVQPPRAGRG